MQSTSTVQIDTVGEPFAPQPFEKATKVWT
jgi:hypothetical protein